MELKKQLQYSIQAFRTSALTDTELRRMLLSYKLELCDELRFVKKLLGEHDEGDQSLKSAGFSIRVRKAALRLGATTVDELCRLSASDLMESKNFGENSLAEVKNILASLGKCLRACELSA